MKKLLFLFLLFVCFIFSPQLVHAEEIKEFIGSVKILKDGEIQVTEQIVYDFGSENRHGIYWTIPVIKTNSEGKKFKLIMQNFSVTNEQKDAYRFTVQSSGNVTELKIGDPDRTITGVHTYIVSYGVRGALTYYSDHDELYWNVSGSDWKVPIGKESTTVTLPATVSGTDVKLACFTGTGGGTKQNCLSSYSGDTATFSTTMSLSSGEGMAVVVGFPKNIVAVLEPVPYVEFSDTALGRTVTFIGFLLIIIFTTAWYFILPMIIVLLWWKYGRDPKSPIGSPHVWFDVPKGKKLRVLTPGETGTVIDEEADMRDITATIVDLARRGYLKIIERKKNDFFLIKESEVKQSDLQPFEQNLYEGIFSTDTEVRIKNEDLSGVVSGTKNKLYDAVIAEGFFDKNPETLRILYTVLAVVALCTFNIPLAIIAFTFGRSMPRKTLTGVEAANIAESIRNFLVSQEHQLEFQARNQLFFEKFLPYAIAFGVEKIWAQRFADISMKQPDWFQGYSGGMFTSIYFASSLGSSLSSFSHAATPTQSTTGFSSGFSGGSSGGGGGGSGGGSW